MNSMYSKCTGKKFIHKKSNQGLPAVSITANSPTNHFPVKKLFR
ncbi:hypothetical protein EV199_1861 [Pseudobacter ginsenosidimutans]|uniref:Uncharacterized protein n=1 Tax=Pseudobacter ginsenosidimutans TaxID=661488 RepID=A0A4Q7N4P8_9BACT|nr:hypothetical protein EV199_1861 [Pseudobacter ginsenosidimutans]